MDTLFAGFSSGVGEDILFLPPNFPPMGSSLLADVGSEGRLTALPPLIFSENNRLRPVEDHIQKSISKRDHFIDFNRINPYRKIFAVCFPRSSMWIFFFGPLYLSQFLNIRLMSDSKSSGVASGRKKHSVRRHHNTRIGKGPFYAINNAKGTLT